MAVAVSVPVLLGGEKISRSSILMARFIIDGIITVPIALYGFLVFPGLPRTTKAFYLSQEVRKCNAMKASLS